MNVPDAAIEAAAGAIATRTGYREAARAAVEAAMPAIREALAQEFMSAELVSDDIIRADAWDEGHHTRWLPDESRVCECAASSDSECACGNYGAKKPAPNPYRGGTP